MKQQAMIANQQSTSSFPLLEEPLVDQVLIKTRDSQFYHQQWKEEEFHMYQNDLPYAENCIETSNAMEYEIPQLLTMNCERKSSASCVAEEEEKGSNFLQGILSQEQIDKLIKENQRKFAQLKLSKKNLI